MARRKLIAANWKMHKTIGEAEAFVAAFDGTNAACDLLLIPPYLSLPRVAQLLQGSSIAVGAQDVFWESGGAFTGEVSGGMILDAGATHVLVGHSERRHVLGEDDDVVARKLTAGLDAGLTAILCVGETLEQREAGAHETVVRGQLESAIGEFDAERLGAVVIAYEPVWAIGTGRTATPADAIAMHTLIRSFIVGRWGSEQADVLRIQYGGSVKPENAAELLAEAEIDGALVGGASLDPGSFAAIAAAVPSA